MNNYPRIIIGGTSSGSGKTTITCGILNSLKRRGLNVSSFKCGPDYIDPMFHEEVIGTPSNNLDSFFLNKDELINLFTTYASNDLSIIEGVMGYYDGINSSSNRGSTYDVANLLQASSILIVNSKGLSISNLAVVKGFVSFKEDSLIKGVIFNNISKKVYDELKEQFKILFPNLSLIGYVPKLDESLLLESRHLGLVTSQEITNLKDKLNKISDILDETLDFDLLMNIASTNPLPTNNNYIEPLGKVKIGVAKDKAFCFYYHSNIKLLEDLGADIIYFSPLKDTHLPLDLDGIYLGGGYPELYLKELSLNNSIKKELKDLLNKGLPMIAECGGFMYLNKSIEGYPMVNFFDGDVINQKHLVRFGYVELTSVNDNIFGKQGNMIKGHEFHYYDVSASGEDFLSKKTSGTTYLCGIASDTYYAGYPHLYFLSNIEMIKNYFRKCMEWKNK